MAGFSEAMQEAFASAPVNEIIYHTIELDHPAFTQPIRLVQGFDDITARLEADAPKNAAELVQFVAAPWDLTLPKIEEDTMPELSLRFDNVSREITQYISEAVMRPEPVKIIIRPYLSSLLEQGPQLNPPIEMEMGEATADNYSVSTTANLEDVFYSVFPTQRYTSERFPTFGYSA